MMRSRRNIPTTSRTPCVSMPELPFIQVLVENLGREVTGRTIKGVRLRSPALLKTVDPPLNAVEGKRILHVRREGKLVVIELAGDLLMAFHLMRDGRLQITGAGGRATKPLSLALQLEDGREIRFIELGPKKRAAVYLLYAADAASREPMAGLGVDPLTGEFALKRFAEMLRAATGQLKHVLTQQRYVTGIGNAFGDEILWEARLSPLANPARLSEEEVARLHRAIRQVLASAVQAHRTHFGGELPMREPLALLRVHRHGGEPCPRCGTRIAAISYAEKETYYCPGCQTGGKVYADRRLSRLLK